MSVIDLNQNEDLNTGVQPNIQIIDDTKQTTLLNNEVNEDIDINKDNIDTSANTPTEITLLLDDKSTVFKLDTNGNAIDETGKIAYTKEQLDSFDDQSDDQPEVVNTLVSKIQDLTKIVLQDEQGQPLTFNDTPDDLAKRELAVSQTFYNQGREKALTTFFAENPDLKQVYEHKLINGSIDGFSNTVNYNNLTIDSNTPDEVLKTVLKQYHKLANVDPVMSDKIIALAVNNETLRVDAIEAAEQVKLKTNELLAKQEQEQFIKNQQAVQEQEQLFGVKFTSGGYVPLNVEGSIYDLIVNKGNIDGIQIPVNGLVIRTDNGTKTVTRQDLFNYFTPTQNGYSQAQIDEYNRMNSKESFLKQGIKNLVGDKYDDLVINKYTTKIVKKVVKTHNTNTQPSNNSNTNTGNMIKGSIVLR